MSIQWDPKKDRGNAKKHEGVRFAECIHQEGIQGIRYIFGLLLVVLLIGIDIHVVKACETHPQPWFLPNFRWDEGSLPEGIELLGNEYYVFVNNTTSEMAWIVDYSQYDALIKAQENDLVGNTNTGLDELVQTLVSQEKRGVSIPSNPRGYTEVRIAPGGVSGLSDEHPKSRMWDPPPPNVEIPNGKVFNIVLVYQQEIYPIRVIMSYSINTKFDKNPCGVEEEICYPKPLMWFGLVIFGIGLVYFLVQKYYIYREE